MKALRLLSSLFVAGLLLYPMWSVAQEDARISGILGGTYRFVGNERESAKFQEYRDLRDGVTADLRLLYQQKDGYFLGAEGDNIGLDDQRYSLTGGRYGSFKYELGYDQIPHRFAFDAKTLYSGVGTGRLTLSSQVQTDLQATAAASAAQVAALQNFFTGAHFEDLELMRKTGRANFDLMKFDPIFFRAEFSREHREGTRPFFGSFGFGNTIELPEPIDYDTTQLKLIGEYSKNPIYVNLTYHLSIFENNIGSLSWDNPFRAADGTSATAYTTTSASGAKRGRIDLYPNNIAHTASLTGSLSDLPLKTRVSATASWGWRSQDDDFLPYTTNTAIATGAVSGVAGVLVPFNTFDKANLPAKSPEATQTTSLYNLLITSRPLGFLNVKGRYRYFEYENSTREISFPGHVRTDAVWEPEPEKTVPTEFRKHTAGVDFGFDVFRLAMVTLGYTYENQRRTNREVDDQNEHTGKVSIDSKPLSWLDLRLSYERAERRGHYEYLVPFIATHTGDEPFEPPVPQLPFLRKFDQADRDRDKVQFLATVYPLDALSITGSATYTQDDFVNSPFGLREARTHAYGLDASYAVTETFNLFAYYVFEQIDSSQKSRQWTPGGVGDPFSTNPGLESNSNWTADNEDRIHTVGGGLEWDILKNKLRLKLTYSFSKSEGEVRFASPVGTAGVDDNNAFVPQPFTEVDSIETHTLNAKLQYRIWKGLSVAVGALWERYDVEDFNNRRFTNVTTTAAGGYNAALLMGTLPKSYDANMVYTKLSYSF